MIAIFPLIHILQPLHKQSDGIHQVIFNSSLCKFFSWKLVLHIESLELCERGLGFAVHLQQVKAAARGNPVYFRFISLKLAAYGCDWIMQSIFSHPFERRKTGIEIFGMKRTLSLFVALVRKLLSRCSVVLRPSILRCTTIFTPWECG